MGNLPAGLFVFILLWLYDDLRGQVLNFRFKVFLIIFFAFPLSLGAQVEDTVGEFFDKVSERYKAIRDYSARLVITRGEEIQEANVIFKAPQWLRMDFTRPEGMVMAIYENDFLVWVPGYSVTFSQKIGNAGDPEEAALPVPPVVAGVGLDIIQRYYTISYNPSPDLMPIDEENNEKVYKIKAVWKSTNEGFRRLDIDIGTDLLLRRIKGTTTANKAIVFDIYDMKINKGIPDSRFRFESPSTGNVIDYFLFDPEN